MATDPFDRIDARLDQLLGPSPRQPKRQNTALQDVELTPEQQTSLIRQIADTGLSGLAAVGNLLDVPASMVRDVLTLRNPLDQLIDPFTDQSRITGRQMLADWGVMSENDPTKWEWQDFVGELPAIALDPLLFFKPVAALGTAGKAVKAAGLLDEVGDVAKATGKATGKRQARMGTTIDDILAARPDAREALETAAGGADKLAGMSGQTVAHSGGIGLPWQADPLLSFGSAGEKFAKGMDYLGEAARWSTPGRLATALFDSSTMGRTTREGQETAQRVWKRKEQSRQAIRGETAENADALRQAGVLGNDDMLRGAAEGTFTGPVKPEVDRFVEMTRGGNADDLAEAQRVGVKLSKYDDAAGVEYVARRAEGYEGYGAKRSAGPLNAITETSNRRSDWLRDFQGGTVGLKQMIRDPEIVQAADDAAAELLARNPQATQMAIDAERVAAARGVISRKYGDQYVIPETQPAVRGTPGTPAVVADPNRMKVYEDAATSILRMTPEQREAGLFASSVLSDVEMGRISTQNAIIIADEIAGVLGEIAKRGGPQVSRLTPKPGSSSIKDVLERAGLEIGDANQGALQNVARKAGLDPAEPGVLEGLARMQVPDDIAKDLTGLYEHFTAPEALRKIMAPIDSFLNAFKGLVTGPFLSFHSRNLVGGMFNNAIIGGVSPKSFNDAQGMIRGGVVKDAHKIPVVARMLRERGLEATPENGTGILRQMAYQYEILQAGPGELGNTIGAASDLMRHQATTADDLIRELPGAVPWQASRVAKKAIGREGATWNPRKATLRGVNEAQHSSFAPSAAGEELGYMVEGLNRLTPFIELLRKGVDPAEATRMVRAAQVDYSARNWSTFQREFLSRLFPFSKFTQGQAAFTARELANNPAGMLSQSIRDAERARGDGSQPTPDYVAQTASIPLGSLEDGSNRYITGLGLPFEDPLSFGGGLQDALLEGLSRMNPLVKAPIEWAVGESFFQRGPGGGRELDDMDPTIGRMLANMAGRDEPVTFPGSKELEFLVGNSPAARLATTARRLSDPRKSALDKLLSETTGLRISDISPAAQDAVLRELLQAQMKQQGASEFSRVNFTIDDLLAMDPASQQQALQLKAVQDMLAQRAKARRAAE